jgi:hypothetical protein
MLPAKRAGTLDAKRAAHWCGRRLLLDTKLCVNPSTSSGRTEFVITGRAGMASLERAMKARKEGERNRSLQIKRRPQRHSRTPAQQIHMLLTGLDTHHPRKIYRHYGGNVGNAQLIGSDEFTAFQARI